MKSSLAGSFLLPVLLAAWGPSIASADNWPSWRGPSHNGVSAEANLPTEWSSTKNLVWKLNLPGSAVSTPIVWGEHIFLTSPCEKGKDLLLLCINSQGKELWQRKLGTGNRNFRGEANSASISPSTDGKYVFAFVGTGELACYDFKGNEIWKFNVQDRYGKFRLTFDMHSTPLLHGDRLYLQLLHSGGAWVVALDKSTGKEVWKVPRKSDARDECEHSYASPTLWRKGNDALLIIHGNDYATGHRLTDGSEVWRVGGLNPKERYNSTFRLIASPVASPDLIIVPSAKAGPVVGLKPEARGLVEAGSPHEQWRIPNNTPDIPSPLIHDGFVYLCRDAGILICLDAKTGKELYSHRLPISRYRASPVYAGGMIYLTGRDGVVTVVKAGPKFEQVAVNKLPDQISAAPAVSAGRLYFRGYEALYAIGTKVK